MEKANTRKNISIYQRKAIFVTSKTKTKICFLLLLLLPLLIEIKIIMTQLFSLSLADFHTGYKRFVQRFFTLLRNHGITTHTQ